MKGIIDGVNFHDLEPQKYWAPPSSWDKTKRIQTLKNRIFSADDPWIGSRKMDGAFYKFVKDEDGNMELLGRSKSVNGDYLNKIEWVPHLMPFFNALPKGTCLLGELYFPNNEGSNKVTTITGCLKEKAIDRQNKGEKLHYYIFDVLAIGGISYIAAEAKSRFFWISKIKQGNQDKEYVEYATYFSGKELWNELHHILSIGGEGMVITRARSFYEPGKRPSGGCMKVKKEIQNTIDCFFDGTANPPTKEYSGKEIEDWMYWEDLKTGEKYNEKLYKEYYMGASIIPVTKPYFNGWAGSLNIAVLKDGKPYRIGSLSGLTDDIKADVKGNKGKVIEISAMEIMDTAEKGLRHAKFLNFRPDLTIEDCLFEKVFG